MGLKLHCEGGRMFCKILIFHLNFFFIANDHAIGQNDLLRLIVNCIFMQRHRIRFRKQTFIRMRFDVNFNKIDVK